MKITVDAQPLLGPKTGVGYYTSNVLTALAALYRYHPPGQQ